MSEKIPYTQVARRITSDIDYIMEEAYLQGKEHGFCDGSIDVKKRVEEAYHKGFEAGQHEATTLEYQQGLDDAWEAAKQLIAKWVNDNDDVFGDKSLNEFIETFSASEAIAKLREYEQQKADEIKVGDEVDYKGMTKYVVTGIVDDDTICGFSLNGLWNANTIKEVTKTGRHFPQVAELLEAMKGGAE